MLSQSKKGRPVDSIQIYLIRFVELTIRNKLAFYHRLFLSVISLAIVFKDVVRLLLVWLVLILLFDNLFIALALEKIVSLFRRFEYLVEIFLLLISQYNFIVPSNFFNFSFLLYEFIFVYFTCKSSAEDLNNFFSLFKASDVNWDEAIGWNCLLCSFLHKLSYESLVSPIGRPVKRGHL